MVGSREGAVVDQDSKVDQDWKADAVGCGLLLGLMLLAATLITVFYLVVLVIH